MIEIPVMPFDVNRIMSGDMPPELREKVDRIAKEFMAVVDSMVEERHLQKGIVRIQLPCSMVFILDSIAACERVACAQGYCRNDGRLRTVS